MADRNEPTASESFATNVPLTDVFGTHPKTLLVSALLAQPPESDPATHFTVNELSRITGLEESTVEAHVEDLESIGVVTKTDELEDATTYVLDEQTDVVDAIRRLANVRFENESEQDDSD